MPQFTRAFVLRLARLSNYCFIQGDRCLVYWNLELWAEQDTRVRTVQHGTYLKVVATPPLDSTVPTDVAFNFAISVDEDETTSVAECTAQPRAHRALALYQVQSTLSKVEVAAPGLPLSFACHQGCESKVHALDLYSPERRALSQHQSNDQTVSWLRQLRHAFNLDGFVECTEEGFVAYITTWFADHSHNPRRPVRIAAVEIGSWQDQIMEAWRDKIDPTALTDIRFISPTPPSTETETTLVLEQNRVDLTHSAGVISVIKQDRRHASTGMLQFL